MSTDVFRAGSQTHSPKLGHRDALEQDSVRSSEVDLNAADANGVTPLMRAVCNGRVEETQELLDGGADVNARRVDGFTPLLLAAFHGHTEVVRVLLEHGADASATCRYETSADMWAKARGFFGIAENLREAVTTKQADAPSDRIETEKLANAVEDSAKNVAAEMEVRVPANELFAPVLVTNNKVEVDENARANELSEAPVPRQTHLTAEMDDGASGEELSSPVPSRPNGEWAFLEEANVTMASENDEFAPEQSSDPLNQDLNEDLQYGNESIDLAFWMAPQDLSTGKAEENQEEVQTRFPEEEINNAWGLEDQAELDTRPPEALNPELATELQTRFIEELDPQSAAGDPSLQETLFQEASSVENTAGGQTEPQPAVSEEIAAENQTETQPDIREEVKREIAAEVQTKPQTQAREELNPKVAAEKRAERLTRPQEFKNKERSAGTQVKRPTRVLDDHWEPPVLVAVDSAPAFRPGEAFMSRVTSVRGVAMMAVAVIIVCGVTTFAIIKMTGGIDTAVERPAVDAAVEKSAVNTAGDKPASVDPSVDKAPAITKSESPAPTWITGLVESGAAGKNEPEANPVTKVVHKEVGPEGQASSIGSDLNQENHGGTSLGFTTEGSSRLTRRSVSRSSVNNRRQSTVPSVAKTAKEGEGERSRGAEENSDYSEAKASGEVRERSIKSDSRSSQEDSQTLSPGSGSSRQKSKVIQWP